MQNRSFCGYRESILF